MTDDAAAASKLDSDPDLVDNVARGSCVLFFGADYPPANPGPPTRRTGHALVSRYPDQVDSGNRWSMLHSNSPTGRAATAMPCISFLKEQVAPAPAWQPTEVHRAIVNLGFDAVVMAWYDDLTERAFDAAGNVWRGWSAGWTPPTPAAARTSSWSSCTETSRGQNHWWSPKEMLRVQGDLAQRLEDVRPFVRLRPILFVGWDPGDETALPGCQRRHRGVGRARPAQLHRVAAAARRRCDRVWAPQRRRRGRRAAGLLAGAGRGGA